MVDQFSFRIRGGDLRGFYMGVGAMSSEIKDESGEGENFELMHHHHLDLHEAYLESKLYHLKCYMVFH